MTDDEKDRALCEAHCNSVADEYFSARPQLDSSANRRIFYAGHRKAWIERSEAAPDEPDWRHPKIQGLIGAAARLRITIELIWQILEDPNQEFTASDMEYWDAIHDKLKEARSTKPAPQPAQQPLTDEQIKDIHWSKPMDEFQFARAIEQAHGIGVKA